MLRNFAQDRSGNFASIAALLSPLLLGLVGGVVDLFVYAHHRSELQEASDAAALAAASEASMKGWSTEIANQVAGSIIGGNLSNRFSGSTFAHRTEVDEDVRRVVVTLSQDHYGYFLMGYFVGSPQIAVTSVAQAAGQDTICIVVQSPSSAEAFSLTGDASVVAKDCSAYSNSSSTAGLAAKSSARLASSLACTAGGYRGTASNFSPLPITDCPQFPDPLAARAVVVDGLVKDRACDHNKLKIEGVNKTLSPGVFCGGLEITDGAVVTFLPGEYVIRDGKMRVDKKATITGTNVGFVFAGAKSKLELKNDSSVSLSARETGPMAGLLVYAQTATGAKRRDFKIESRNAQKLVGTVYVPSDHLVIGGDKDGDGKCDPDVSGDGEGDDEGSGDDETGDDEGSGDDQSASPLKCEADVGATSSWTAIVAHTLNVTGGVDLVINANYESSPVPVPPGLGPNSSQISLAK